MRALALLAGSLCLYAFSGQLMFYEDGRALRWEGFLPVTYYVGSDEFGIDRSIIVSSVATALAKYKTAGGAQLPEFVAGTVPPPKSPTLVVREAHDCANLKASRYPNQPLQRTILVVADIANKCYPQKLFLPRADTLPAVGDTGIGVSLITLPPPAMKAAYANGTLDRLILHEVGHALGLSHTIVHDAADLRDGGYLKLRTVPVMFPYISVPDSVLTESDVAWLRYLYREGRTLPRGSSVIWGAIRKQNGQAPPLALNVIAIDSVSGKRFSGLTGFPADGDFHIPVESGRTYQLIVHAIPHERVLEPLRPDFFGFRGDSGFGPYVYRPEKKDHELIEPLISDEPNPVVSWTNRRTREPILQVEIPPSAKLNIRLIGRMR